jgi:hypothetical protein
MVHCHQYVYVAFHVVVMMLVMFGVSRGPPIVTVRVLRGTYVACACADLNWISRLIRIGVEGSRVHSLTRGNVFLCVG